MAKHREALAALALPPVFATLVAAFVLETTWNVALFAGIAALFMFCDAWYFIRLSLWLLHEAVDDWWGLPRKHLFEASELPGRILPMDIDRNAHCNNARFLRECGFGRRDLWHRNGVWKIIRAHGGNLVIGTQTVRYRRELSLGQRYFLQTRLLCWDERAFYVEHRFVTFNESTDHAFVHAIVLAKNNVLGKLTPAKIVSMLPNARKDETTNPSMPDDVAKWIESNDASSKTLRAEAAAHTKRE
ncbi:hypothetical protein P43SY_005556 [Pythium insidiosum]|uniref:Uncharacterized protein n=1 Tax=Pythium insidiosum TaxID=114742 RepID=A0AAD5QCI1_PYTIN|nr:hypothetical protein P43SY_005556 [Pythium insidiosum]KAJ0407969.1 hypothetical protein ATCC90586_001997 [Pythium insidiosum]